MATYASVPTALRKQLTFLIARGAHLIPHGTDSLLMHLVATRNVLHRWAAPAPVCAAGLCHSVYGTSRWSRSLAADSERSTIREMIGVRAEEIVSLYSRVDVYGLTPSQLMGSDPMRCRITGESLRASAETRRNLLHLAAANLVAVFPLRTSNSRAKVFLREGADLLSDPARCEVRRLLRS